MEFYTFGDSSHKAIILIYGVLTLWQIWEEAIAYLKKRVLCSCASTGWSYGKCEK